MDRSLRFFVAQDAAAQKRKLERRANWAADYAATLKRLEGLPGGTAAKPCVYMTPEERRTHVTCNQYVDLLTARAAAVDREKALSEIKVALSVRL
jgi:hypothetical protein